MRPEIPVILDGIPDCLTGAAAWLGPEMARSPERWLYQLTADDIADLERGAERFLAEDRDIGEITKSSFQLRTFDERLAALTRKLLHGVGVEVIRGLPVEKYSQRFSAAIFCGIGAHLGRARSQNGEGHILGHVRDLGKHSQDAGTRIYQTAERQTFHTDSADVVGLMCLRTAKQGGASLLVSAETIYNRMRASRPDLLALLFDPIATDRRGEVPIGAEAFMRIPPFNWHREKLTVFYQRQYIDSAQRLAGVEKLTDAHIEALDMFDALANDPTLNFSMNLQPGDMQFVYNHAQLHDRTAFTDWPDIDKRRHLMRLWLSLDGDRELPEAFKERYGSITIGARGGIVTSKTKLHAPID